MILIKNMGFLTSLERKIRKYPIIAGAGASFVGFLAALPFLGSFAFSQYKQEKTDRIVKDAHRSIAESNKAIAESEQIMNALIKAKFGIEVDQAVHNRDMDALRKKDEQSREKLDEVIEVNERVAEGFEGLEMNEEAENIRKFVKKLKERR